MHLMIMVLLLRLAVLFAQKPAPTPEFRFASLMHSNMVLQQAPARANVWGFATAAAQVTVSFQTIKINTTADSTGRWQIQLPPTPATSIALDESHTIGATSAGTSLTLSGVLFGDVWVCGGQSNMVRQMSWANASEGEMNDAAENYPFLRLFQVGRTNCSTEPLQEFPSVDLSWSKPGDLVDLVSTTPPRATARAIENFAAVCYYFGRGIYNGLPKEQKVPIGLVLSSLGGTQDECWSSREALAKCGIKPAPKPRKCKTGKCGNALLWNAMVSPMTALTVKGAVFYQGEANAKDPTSYNCTFPAMVDDWRAKFHAGSKGETAIDFPFGFVQLNAVGAPWATRKPETAPDPFSAKDGFAGLRWAQSSGYGVAPNPRLHNTWMAVTLDTPCNTNTAAHFGDTNKKPCGNYGNWSVHSAYKQPTGERLAHGALVIAYNSTGASAEGLQGPVAAPAHVASDGTVSVMFTGFAGELDVRKTMYSDRSFELYDAKRGWVNATIASSTSNTITLGGIWKTSTHLRYLWTSTPCLTLQCPIYSSGGYYKLPAAPFFQVLARSLLASNATVTSGNTPLENNTF